MKREIKFRMWCPFKAEMYHNDNSEYIQHIHHDGTISYIPYNDAEFYSYYEGIEDDIETGYYNIIPMQYTGFKDKTGKEIYDGDIVEFDINEWGGSDNIHIVSWDDKTGSWDWGGGCTSDMLYRTVIGNIYENPELIK